MVHDEGPGFDMSCLGDPTDPDKCMRCSGRGIYIMRQVMDSVEFDMSDGTTVTMTKGVA
jgi:anti-sigma regulatory factor (Ser/Thr protein kinase)